MRLRFIPVVLLVLLAACAAAPGRVVLSDETGALGRGEVEAAAAPLIERGAVVAVFVVPQGDDTGADFSAYLAEAGLLDGGQIAPDAIALYVSYAPRYSELRAGTRWSGDLPDATLREVREGALNPALRTEEPTAGVTATLAALEARLASPPLLRRAWVAFPLVALAGLGVGLWAVSPLGTRTRRRLRRSALGRLYARLTDHTPSGRERIARLVGVARARVEDRAAYARSWCQAAVSGRRGVEAGPLMARLKVLDQQRAALRQGVLASRDLLESLEHLAAAYEALGREATDLAPARGKGKGGRAAAAASGAAFSAGAAETYAGSSSSDSSSSSWDSGSSSDTGGPSSDGGSW